MLHTWDFRTASESVKGLNFTWGFRNTICTQAWMHGWTNERKSELKHAHASPHAKEQTKEQTPTNERARGRTNEQAGERRKDGNKQMNESVWVCMCACSHLNRTNMQAHVYASEVMHELIYSIPSRLKTPRTCSWADKKQTEQLLKVKIQLLLSHRCFMYPSCPLALDE